MCAGRKESGSPVLLGDPQQLEQPQKGSHPEGSDISALAHLLDRRRTINEEQGLFLAQTWRLHPSICSFTSELFYEGRLASLDGLERQIIEAPGPFAGAGLWFVPVVHEGNRSYSTEEVEGVAAIIDFLTSVRCPACAYAMASNSTEPGLRCITETVFSSRGIASSDWPLPISAKPRNHWALASSGYTASTLCSCRVASSKRRE